MTILIKQATILSPNSPHHLKKRDLLLRNGSIEKIAASISSKASKIIQEKELYVSEGWKDIFADFCDPGFEHKEDIQSGMAVAKAGGYTGVCLVPNTYPTIHSKSQVEYIKNQERDGGVKLYPIGAVSQDVKGETLAEMYDMNQAGAPLFSDGKKSIQSAGLVLKALQYLKTIKGTLIQVPDTQSISANGLMNEGKVSTQLGMPGIPTIAEHLQIQRDITLCEYAESRIHFTGVSTKQSIALIAAAKKRGTQVSCSVAPYHLLYTDSELAGYDSNFKVFPPLRTQGEKNFLIKALKEGKIDGIASHHTPQDMDAKKVEFAYAQEGLISLQYMLPLLLEAGLSAEEIARVTTGAFKSVTGLDSKIEVGASADICLFSTKGKTTISKETNLSKSDNTPLMGRELKGRIIGTILGSKLNLC
jgi:dihydroorotase